MGVRYSLKNPRAYFNSNVIGTFNAIEAARRLEVTLTDGIDLVGLWRKYRDAVYRDREGRHAADNLCRVEEC